MSAKKALFSGNIIVQNDEWRYCAFVPAVKCDLNMLYSNGVPEYSYTLSPNMSKKEEHRYAYNIQKGLFRVGNRGELQDDYNVIGDFMKLSFENNEESAKQLFKYISKYGFFFVLPDSKEVLIKHTELCAILKKYKELFDLYYSVNQNDHDYSYILIHTVNILIDSDEHSISADNNILYSTCVHTFAGYLKNPYTGTVLPQHDAQNNRYLEGWRYVYDINDTYLNKSIKYYYTSTKQAEENPENPEDFRNSDTVYGRLKALYDTLNDSDIRLRNTVDLLYHILKNNKPISAYDNEKAVNNFAKVFLKNADPDIYNKPDDEAYKKKLIDEISTIKINEDEQAVSLLMQVTNQTIADEINHCLSGTHICFNAETKRSFVYVKDLLTAMYLALATFDPRTQMFRKCKREKCGRFFLDKKSHENAGCCCKKCASAEYTRLSRKRKKECDTQEQHQGKQDS